MKLRSKWTLGLFSLVVAAMGSFMVASAQSPSPQTPPPQNKPDSKPDKKPEEKHPRLAVFGHIHNAAGEQAELGPTKLVNAGPDGVFLEVD